MHNIAICIQNSPKNMQRYKKISKYSKKCIKNTFFCKNIWSYQKKAVPLHSLSKRKCAGCSSARLECLLWEQEVVSSNLAIPTNQINNHLIIRWLFYFFSVFFSVLCISLSMYHLIWIIKYYLSHRYNIPFISFKT